VKEKEVMVKEKEMMTLTMGEYEEKIRKQQEDML